LHNPLPILTEDHLFYAVSPLTPLDKFGVRFLPPTQNKSGHSHFSSGEASTKHLYGTNGTAKVQATYLKCPCYYNASQDPTNQTSITLDPHVARYQEESDNFLAEVHHGFWLHLHQLQVFIHPQWPNNTQHDCLSLFQQSQTILVAQGTRTAFQKHGMGQVKVSIQNPTGMAGPSHSSSVEQNQHANKPTYHSQAHYLACCSVGCCKPGHTW